MTGQITSAHLYIHILLINLNL